MAKQRWIIRRLAVGYLGIAWLCSHATAQTADSFGKKTLLFSDDFSSASVRKEWIVETVKSAANKAVVVDGQLELDTEDGITVWYKQKLAGNCGIEYDRTVMMNGGAHDRLSDLNQFWMATDPQQKMFRRTGGFREYDSLQMYYVGMGGNYNTTTRMRRYNGKGRLQIVGEFTDSAHLLRPNVSYHISIAVRNGRTTFAVNGETYFSFTDEQPFREGWFAIRSTKSRQRIDNVRIYSLMK